MLLIALAAASFFFLFFIGYPFALSRDLMSVFLGSFLASFLVYMAIYVSTSNDFDLKIKKNKEAFFDFEHHPEIQQAIYKMPEIAAYIERVAAQLRLLTVAEADAIESAFNKFNAEKRMIIIRKAAQGVLERNEASGEPNMKANVYPTVIDFTTGTAENLSEMLSVFIPVSQSDNSIFSQRAISFMNALMLPLVYLRDQKAISLSSSIIREYMPLDKIMLLAGFPEKKPVHGVEIPDDVVLPLRAYLRSVAGFNEKKETQAPETSRQHDFSQEYFTRVLASS